MIFDRTGICRSGFDFLFFNQFKIFIEYHSVRHFKTYSDIFYI